MQVIGNARECRSCTAEVGRNAQKARFRQIERSGGASGERLDWKVKTGSAARSANKHEVADLQKETLYTRRRTRSGAKQINNKKQRKNSQNWVSGKNNGERRQKKWRLQGLKEPEVNETSTAERIDELLVFHTNNPPPI
jgi:hypothetical protein